MTVWVVGWVLVMRAPVVVLAENATTQPTGPDVVVMKELAALYEPVPFDHKGHAQMAQMWDGCVTCHHRTPEAKQGDKAPQTGARTQEQAAKTPKCKTCHRVGEETQEIRMPNLKGAYHRQCLNCHKEWMHGNACVICHKPKDPKGPVAVEPTPDDVVGRIHPPIPEPGVKVYQARFTPAVGKNVTFRHKEHTTSYGIKCVECHRRDNCGDCHAGKKKISNSPLKPGRTWEQSHAPCMSCHPKERCGGCHYKDEGKAPKRFEHALTGQVLDKDHAGLKCGQCHPKLRSREQLNCGGSECHKDRLITWPADRPGEMVTKAILMGVKNAPATRPSVQLIMDPIALPATRPATTRPVRGGGV